MNHAQNTRTLVVLLLGGFVLLIIVSVGWSMVRINMTDTSVVEQTSPAPALRHTTDVADLSALNAEGLTLSVLSHDSVIISPDTRLRIERYTATEFEQQLGLVKAAASQQSPANNLVTLTVLNDYMDLPIGTGGQSLRNRLDSHGKNNTAILLSEILPDVELLTSQLAAEFNLARPTQLDSTLTVIDHNNYGRGPSMPSVLATKVYLTTAILTDLDPVHEREYTVFAETVADQLVISGHHFPVDVEVASEIAQNIYEILRTNDRYQFLFEAAKTDWSNQ